MDNLELNETSILMILAKCEVEVTTDQLFDLITDKGASIKDPISFVKILNNLREIQAIGFNYDYDSLIHWKITEFGMRRI